MSHNQLGPSDDFKRVLACFDLLKDGLARYGYVIPGYPEEVATIEALAILKNARAIWQRDHNLRLNLWATRGMDLNTALHLYVPASRWESATHATNIVLWRGFTTRNPAV